MRTIWAENEFRKDGTVIINGDCGPNALAMMESYVFQKYVQTINAFHAMRANGWCDPNGASNASEVYSQAVKDGCQAEVRPYGEPWPDWYNWVVARMKNNCAIVLNIANGQALVDTLSGKGENANNLHYHFIALVEYHPGGWNARLNRTLGEGMVAVDGDNYSTPYAVTTSLCQFYPIAVLNAAKPCGAIAAKNQGGSPVSTPTNTGVPTGWSDTNVSDWNGVLSAPGGHTIIHGFRQFVLTYPGGWPANDVPLEQERAIVPDGSKVIQTFAYSQLRYDQAANPNITKGNIGADWLTLTAQVAALVKQVSGMNDQIKSLTDTVNSLQLANGQANEALAVAHELKDLLDKLPPEGA